MGNFDQLFRDSATLVIDLFTDTPITIRREVDPYSFATGIPDYGVTGTDFTRATGSFTADGFTIADKVQTSGFSLAGNNGLFTVTAVGALTLTVAETLAAEADAPGKKILRVVDHVLKASPPIRYKLAEIDGSAIQRGDFALYVAAANLTIEPTPELDHVIRNGSRYHIVFARPFAGGDQIALYQLQCRQ